MQMLVLSEKVPRGMEEVTLNKILRYVMAFESEFDKIHVITSYDYSGWATVPPNLFFHRAEWHESTNRFLGFFMHVLYLANVFWSSIFILKRNRGIGVVSNSWGYYTLGFLAVALSKAMRRKSIVRVAGDIEVGIISVERRYGRALSRPLKFFLLKMEELVFRHSDFIISVSESIFERCPWIKEKTFIIPDLLPFVEEYARNMSCLEKESPGTGIKIIYVGRLEPEKGIDILMESLKELIPSIKQGIQCNILGDGSLRKEIEARAREIEGHVSFLGNLPQEKVYELICDSDILVLPSYTEFTPVVIIEAMSIGTPVVASYVGGIRYMIKDGENGFTFEKGSVQELTRVLTKVINDSRLRREVCERAKEHVYNEFSPDKIKNKAIQALSQIQ